MAMVLPDLWEHMLWYCAIAYWMLAIVIALLKVVDPRLDAVLRYGRLKQAAKIHLRKGNGLGIALLRLTQLESGHTSRAAWTGFYVIGVLCGLMCLQIQQSALPNRPALVLIFFVVQVMRRLFECVFVHKFSNTHISFLHLLLGFSFYIAAPVTLLVCTRHLNASFYISSILMFLLASAVQNVAHRTLANVKPLVGKYGLPRGSLFGAVACPHYAAEIVIYGVFLTMAPSLPCALMFVFVVINLSQSGRHTVEWYSNTFRGKLAPGEMQYVLAKYVF